MEVYQNGGTYHLFPYCRGVFGEKMELPAGAKICKVCKAHSRRLERGQYFHSLYQSGHSYASMATRRGISRQCVRRLAMVYEESL